MSIYEYPDLWLPGAVEMEAYPDIERSPYSAMLADDEMTTKSNKKNENTVPTLFVSLLSLFKNRIARLRILFCNTVN